MCSFPFPSMVNFLLTVNHLFDVLRAFSAFQQGVCNALCVHIVIEEEKQCLKNKE